MRPSLRLGHLTPDAPAQGSKRPARPGFQLGRARPDPTVRGIGHWPQTSLDRVTNLDQGSRILRLEYGTARRRSSNSSLMSEGVWLEAIGLIVFLLDEPKSQQVVDRSMDPSPEQAIELQPYHVALFIFSVWMLVDAFRRRSELYWFAIILLLPFGSVVYFFIVKLRDYRGKGQTMSGHQTPAPELGELQHSRAPKSPEVLLARADNLEEHEKYDEAMSQYQLLLESEPQNLHAMHGMARCLLGKGNPDQAVGYLERVVETDRAFRNYGAALDYAEALWQAGHESDCIDLVDALATHTGRFNHRVAVGHYLASAGRVAEARQRLTRIVDDYKNADPVTMESNRPWAQRAERLLTELE